MFVHVVEPDAQALHRLEPLLREELGCDFLVFRSVADARGAAEERRPDVVLADWLTLEGEGREWRGLVADDPLIALFVSTRERDVGATTRAVAAVGPLRHLAKPFAAAELLPKLTAAVEQRRLALDLAIAREELSRRDRALRASEREMERTAEELRSTHSELRTATERLVESEQLAAVGRVVAGIAHEIGNQLALVGYARAIRDRVSDDAELKEYAEIIVSAQQRLAATVEQIRDFARGHEGLVREPADLVAVVDEALGLLQYDSDVKARNVALSHSYKPLVLLHHEKFTQVIINLVSNAVLATEPGDTVSVAVFADEESGHAVVEVADSGTGMPKEVLERLGEPFFTTRGDRGAGLGVGICMRIVEDHGGTLTYKSEMGQGTTARVLVPCLEGG